jgi:hypothetical protein
MSEANLTQIYVRLLDEGTDVWRPIDALALGSDLYRIISPDPDPNNEVWEYKSGQIVRCTYQTLSGGEVLVAVEWIRENDGTHPGAK